MVDERFVDVGEARVRYLHAGAKAPNASAPPVLFLHGLLGYSFSWRYNLEHFGQQAEVVALDLPGTGFSSRAPGMDCSQGAAASRILEFMDQVSIETADVVGTSHGGALAMRMAALGEERGRPRVRRLVLVGAANPWSHHGRMMAAVFGSRVGSALALRLQPRAQPLHHLFLARMYGDRRRIRPGTLEGYMKAFSIPGTLEYALAVARCWGADMGELKQALPAIRHIPVLLLWGTRDRPVPARSAPRLGDAFQNARLELLPGVGHLPYEEVPEEFNRIVSDFLRAPAP